MTGRTALDRREVIDGLRDVVHRLRAASQPALIQLVGGAAIALTIDGDRPPTKDIDATVTPALAFRSIAAEVGAERGWPEGWLDEDAAIFLPSQFGRGAEWITLFEADGVTVQVASRETLLAMKLMAVRTRPLRDADDLALLLAATGITSPEEAERVQEAFFPGDSLSPKVWALVEALLAQHRAPATPPEPPDLN